MFFIIKLEKFSIILKKHKIYYISYQENFLIN